MRNLESRLNKLEEITGQKKKGPDKLTIRIKGSSRTFEVKVRDKGDYEKNSRKIEKT